MADLNGTNVERVVWWSRASTSLTQQSRSRRSVVHLREPGADRTLCGVFVDWRPSPEQPGDRDCKRCATKTACFAGEDR